MAPLLAIGLMSGTSLDGVDAALLETDGKDHVKPLHGLTVDYDEAFQQRLRALIAGGQTHYDRLSTVRDLTLLHAEAVQRVLIETSLQPQRIAMIGFHGQTIFHQPDAGITEQAGDAPLLEARTGIRVISDFRRPLVARGGQGAPLVPVYHQALAAPFPKPVVFLNIGGVANLTYIAADGTIIAMDTGPGNALLNDWVQRHLGRSYDENGALALAGSARPDIVAAYMRHNFFTRSGPKSLDRNAFSLALVEGLDAVDGAATLALFAVEAIRHALRQLNAENVPLYVCGGGRKNPAFMQQLNHAQAIEALGHNGDTLEAEAFAYLAVRVSMGLKIDSAISA